MCIATFMIRTHTSYVIVQCIVIASILYCYNYHSSCYLYVRLISVTDSSFTLFPLIVAGLVYQHSVRNRITIEANSQFSQFVSWTIINYYSYYYCSIIYAWTYTWLCSPQASNNNNNNMEKYVGG